MKAIVLFSGGLDSTTCLAMALTKYRKEEVLALSIYYGQKHDKELEASNKIVRYYGVNHQILDLKEIFEGSACSLLKQSMEAIPKESYAYQLAATKNKNVSTYVPFRNGLFLSVAASIALSNGASEIFYGIHADDAGNAYPDTSIPFHKAIREAIYLGSGNEVELFAPFVEKSKSEVVKEGLKLNVPYELTWSCYEGHEKACGRCATCLDRIKAFKVNGVKDPILYEVEIK